MDSESQERGDDTRINASVSAADLRHIAAVVKSTREAQAMTQRELASRAGVSAGLIGQIETSRSRPSVSTLLDIARVLGLSLDALFRPTETERATATLTSDRLPPFSTGSVGAHGSPDDVTADGRESHLSATGHIEDHVVRSGDCEMITLEGGVQWELLTPEVDHNVSFMIVTYPPGTASSASKHLLRHDDNEYFYLLEGVLQVRLAFEETTLYPGDAMSFDSSRPHRFENRAAIQAVGVWAVARKGPAG
jgi:DNA-binding XRE family transcriptional regulator/quercetin dioxygenase-like cupin family protein